MKVVKNIKGSVTEVHVYGAITTIDDTQAIKKMLIDAFGDDMRREVHLIFEDAYVISSSLIGYLIKLARADKANITIFPKDAQLYNLISTLSLVEILNVKKV